MGKRGQNEGSITYHRAKRLWLARLPNNLGREARYFRTKAEAREWLQERLGLAAQGRLSQGRNLTVAEFLDYWLRTITVRPKTRASYESVIRCHLVPALGTLRLRDLRPADIQALYADLRRRGLAEATVHCTHRVLHRALRCAVLWQVLAVNPLDSVIAPPRGRPRVAYWTSEEVQRFLAAVADHRWYALYVLAVSTGARQGELLGLRWEDVDLERGQVSFVRTVQWVRGQGLVVGEPKTPEAVRTLPLTRMALRALRAHRESLVAQGRLPSGYVFATASGTPVSGRNLLRHFRDVVQRQALPPIRFHDLRHTAATLLLAEGVPDRIVAELLGHRDPALTKRVYQHVMPRLVRQATDALERALGGE